MDDHGFGPIIPMILPTLFPLCSGSQFAEIDAGFLSWDFTLLDEEARRIGNIGRNFQGFAREVSWERCRWKGG